MHGEEPSQGPCRQVLHDHAEGPYEQVSHDAINLVQTLVFDAAGPSFNPLEFHDSVPQAPNSEPPNPKAKKFYDLLSKAKEPLYKRCEKHSTLSAMSRLLNIKSDFNISQSCYDRVMHAVKEFIPYSTLCSNYYEFKKIVSQLGLGYQKIDICPNGYTAQHMAWHHEYRRDPGVLSHPSDGEAWKHFDRTHPPFATEPRNVSYGMLSGWSTHGKLSCPYWIIPLEETKMVLSRDELRGMHLHLGKEFTGFGVYHNWTKRSIFWDLPYWHTNLIRHNLDVMHVEKNVFDNIFNTIMDDNDKTKDNGKARQDVKEYCKRRELELVSDVNGKVSKPKASFSLTKEQKQSHDCHVFMERLLPIAFREMLPEPVWKAMMEVSLFFRDLCSTTLKVDQLDKMEKKYCGDLVQTPEDTSTEIL
nr:hypothetical protein [Tanacetum cinerariifolium]